MAARLSAKRLPRYSLEFKLKAVKLTRIPGMEVQAVAEALEYFTGNPKHIITGSDIQWELLIIQAGQLLH